MPVADRGTIVTVKDRCRVCFTCVRMCPAKAIRIEEGQAEVMVERCIGCGNCVKVCSQGAKQIIGTVERARKLLAGERKVAAVVAPSFPAEFEDCDHRTFVGMIRKLGFHRVNEVAFGADLVAAEYTKLLSLDDRKRYIATSCPAVVLFVEKYYPQAVSHLAPIVSPMVAMARALRQLHGNDIRIIFIGPCSAKKCESVDENLKGDTDAVLTFDELRRMFDEDDITADDVKPSEFDPPHAGDGQLFPISRGMLQAADLREDLLDETIVAADGSREFIEALREFVNGDLDARLLEVLACNGCIMGAGMRTTAPLFNRRSRVSRYVQARMREMDRRTWKQEMQHFRYLDLTRDYTAKDQRVQLPEKEVIREILARMGKEKPEDELNCGACGYDTCVDHAIAIHKGLAESEMCLPYTIQQLQNSLRKLKSSHEELASTRQALVQSEKLASMGQLAAGIAHEVNNPLGVVLMYAHLLLDECPEESLRKDLGMIAEQADRCKKIVSGLLHFARQDKVVRTPTDVTKLIEQCLQSAPKHENVVLTVENNMGDPVAEIDHDQILQVLVNLVGNAYQAMPEGGELSLSTREDEEHFTIRIRDTGTGIPEENLNKIFEPFFTTKQIGKGTGLGLAVTYGIVKMHRGNIRVESNADPAVGPTGTTFILTLPRTGGEKLT